MVLLFPSMVEFPDGARPEAALDIVTLTTMEWAIWQTGEPVVIWDRDTDLTGVKKLAICGHGAPGSIEYVPAQDIAALVTDKRRGCKNTLQHLVVTACFAGIPVTDPSTSTIAVLAEALQIRNLAISGANGPSIKHPSTGSIRSLAIPSLMHSDITVALNVQESVLWKMAPKYEFAEIAYDARAMRQVARFRKYSVAKFVDELTKGTRWRTWHSISSEYAIRATEFFRVFLEQVEQQKVGVQQRSMLYSKEDGLTTVYWDGTTVVTGTPPSWPVFLE